MIFKRLNRFNSNREFMKITIYSIKGSAGKTPIAVNIALEKGWALGTNEPVNLLDQIINEDQFMTIEPKDAFPALPDDFPIVFDLAGHISKDASASIRSAVEQSNVVLVPVYNELKCLHAGIATLTELQAFKTDIVIVATKLQKQKGEYFKDWNDSADCKNIRAVIEHATGKEYPIFPLKFSKVFDTIFEQERSINQIMDANGLAKHTYREIGQQFDTLMSYLEKRHAV